MNKPVLRASPELVAAIIASLNNDGTRWSRGKYTLDHKSGVRLWDGLETHVMSPREIRLGWWPRRSVDAAMRRWKARNPIDPIDHGADIIAMLRRPA